jgi:hypothetical protein
VRERIDSLPLTVRRLLIVTALAAAPSVDLLADVEGLDADTVRSRLAAAVDAQVVDVGWRK